MYDQLRADFPRVRIAKFNHLSELVSGIDVEQREEDRPGVKRFLRQSQHDRRIFADRIKQDWALEFGGHFAHDVNALGFEQAKMAELRHQVQFITLST